MTGLEHAVIGLREALAAPRLNRQWRWLVRHRIAAAKAALAREHTHEADAWLAARQSALIRERDALVRRLNDLGSRVLDDDEPGPVHAGLDRLVADLERHRQRLSDLVYDTVSLELGGSE